MHVHGRLAYAVVMTTAIAATLACSQLGGSGGADSTAATSSASDSMSAATPVHMAVVERGNMAITVSGPGHTDALDLQQIRAPFTGTLTLLHVVVGDRVGSGQQIGTIVSQPSEAALRGAESMRRTATTPSERSDAARALELARQNLIATPLRAPRAGVVVSRGASQGDLVTQGDSIASIAAAGSIAFVARVAQSDLTRVVAGQRATVDFPGRAVPAQGVVHGLLPADTSGGMTVPVRIDLRGAPQAAGMAIASGLFGTVQIVVGERTNVPIVPTAAVLRDDISGVSRVAVVTRDGKAHWVTVTTGASAGDRVEIVSPTLAAGERVIVSGQVGLPDGSRVREGGSIAGPSGGVETTPTATP